MVPYKTPELFKRIWPKLHWQVAGAEKQVFLTFDDGPIPELTPWVLDELAKYNAKATFFCVGENVNRNPAIFQRILNEGHAVGNHTHNHLNGRRVPNEQYFENIDECDLALERCGGKTNLFRPPYGRFRQSQLRRLSDRKVVMWSVLTKDYVMTLEPEQILKQIIPITKSGSIIVFHDNVKAEKNLKAVLPAYLSHFSKVGYQFSALS